MKRLLTIGAIVLFTGGVAAAQTPAKAAGGKATGGVTQALTDMENQWVKASLASDGDALAPLLSEDFVTIDSDGSMHGKAEVVARTKKAKWKTMEIGNLKVIEHGDTAIVTGSWTGNGTDGSGKAVNGKERWADTWVKANGKWQCVASAAAPVK